MNDTPIYTEAFREAKRRTRRHSPERRDLELMNVQTDPEEGPALRARAEEVRR